jgi:histidyl-tRNA synthetase
MAQIRALGIGAQIAMRGSLRAQLRHADKRGAAFAIIIGEDELARGEVTLRDMRSGEQTMVAVDELADVLTARLDA